MSDPAAQEQAALTSEHADDVTAAEGLREEELLVEDVLIHGMCDVYQ